MRETEMQMMESDGDEENKRWVLGDGRPLRWEVDGVRETSERAWDLPGGRWERFCVSPLDGNGERGFKGYSVAVNMKALFWVFSTVGTRGPMISNAQVEKGHGAVVGCSEDAGA
ncbi:hypothetical protein MRB53_006215 [Persea americana]|uniref:Uncharacterized protein n=1 Tax=Persea americana TaxID=3435 RepID=A0ACC2MFI2_PERAE|nr:hypothetical protein MRB53_006215 [Persea americana]